MRGSVGWAFKNGGTDFKIALWICRINGPDRSDVRDTIKFEGNTIPVSPYRTDPSRRSD